MTRLTQTLRLGRLRVAGRVSDYSKLPVTFEAVLALLPNTYFQVAYVRGLLLPRR